MKLTLRFPRVALLILLLWGYGAASLHAAGRGAVPGVFAGERVRVVVLFNEEPVASLRSQLGSGAVSLTAAGQARLRRHQNRLHREHEAFLRDASAAGLALEFNHSYSYLLNGLALSVRAEDVGRLAALPGVAAVREDQQVVVRPEGDVNLALPAVPSAPAENRAEAGGEGITVAIVDTGIDYTHPDLGGCFGRGCKVAGGYDLRNGDADPLDDNGHGTHCAGIVAADGALRGVAPGATLYAYKVLDENGVGAMSTVIAGIERAVDPDQDPGTDDGAEVISLSLGSPGHPDDPWSLAVDAAVESGVTVVVSAGNAGPDYGHIGSPGVARKALAVGATDAANAVAAFSSRGPVPGFDQLMKPQVVAPGVEVNSTWLGGTYASLSGTSMAAPYAAGAAALVKQAHPAWTPEMVQAALMNSAEGLGSDVYTQGAGKVNPTRAAGLPFLVSPGTAGLGMVDMTQQDWTAAQTVQVTNVGPEAARVTLSIEGVLPPGTSAVVVPDSLAVQPGETAPVTLRVAVETGVARPDLEQNEGRLLVQSGSHQTRVAFAFRLPELFTESNTLPIGVQTSFGVDLGDLDGDGDADAFVANANYYDRPGNTVWWNEGEGLFADSGQRLGGSFSWAVDLGDLDADGDLDAFVANSEIDGPLPDEVWLNDGSGRFSLGQSLGHTNSRDVQLGDLDGDGDPDAFVTNSSFANGRGEGNSVWVNDGRGNFADSGQSIGSSMSQAVALGDLDGDGDLDAFVANGVTERGFGRANKVWLNDGRGRFADSGQSLGDVVSQDVALGDLDGDGDLDAFIANGGPGADDGAADEVWLNNGTAIFVNSGRQLGYGSSYGVALADLHGDGYLDAFVAASRGGNRVWINDGRGRLHAGGLTFGSESAAEVVAGDVDGDGDADALVVNALGRQNRVWLNRGSGAAATGELVVAADRADGVWSITGAGQFTGRGSRRLTGVPAGRYQVTWGSVPGCGTPPPAVVTLPAGEALALQGNYAGCPPSAPTLTIPADNARVDATPTVNWLSMPSIAGYRLQVAAVTDFSVAVVDQSVTGAGYTVSSRLAAGEYYWRVRATSADGSSGWSKVRSFRAIDGPAFPFHEGFESAELGPAWGRTTTGSGRVTLSSEAAQAGTQGLLLEDGLRDGSYSRSAADLMLDLEGRPSAALSFWWRSWGESNESGQSGVFFSDDYGCEWHRVLAFAGSEAAFRRESVDIAAAAARHGLALHDHFLVRFQSVGDAPAVSGGGYAVDEVSVGVGLEGPTQLTLTAVSASQIDLSWRDNAADESAYIVERMRDSSAGGFTRIATADANSTTFSDTGLSCNTRYTYRVCAYRGSDDIYSAFSNTAVLSTAPCGNVLYLPAVAAMDRGP